MTNYKHQYEIVKKIAEQYQDELVPGFRAKIAELEAEPVRHGRWEKSNYNGSLCCSECKDVYIDKTWFGGGKWNYCPNCGAKMDGDGNGY